MHNDVCRWQAGSQGSPTSSQIFLGCIRPDCAGVRQPGKSVGGGGWLELLLRGIGDEPRREKGKDGRCHVEGPLRAGERALMVATIWVGMSMPLGVLSPSSPTAWTGLHFHCSLENLQSSAPVSGWHLSSWPVVHWTWPPDPEIRATGASCLCQVLAGQMRALPLVRLQYSRVERQ